jgi:hypothetical protein
MRRMTAKAYSHTNTDPDTVCFPSNNGTPVARWVRKASGLMQIAGLPKYGTVGDVVDSSREGEQMSRYRMLAGLALGGAIAISACTDDPTSADEGVVMAAPASGGNQNAQSIMFTSTLDNLFIVQGEETWHLNFDAARLLFTATPGAPVISCTGGGRGGADCLPANQPPTPSALAASTSEPPNSFFTAQNDKNRCALWNGLALDTPPSYTQNTTINGANGGGNWKYVWTYTFAALSPQAARTAWELITSAGATVAVEGYVAGQSLIKKPKTGNNDWGFKVSHTITELGLARVSNLSYTVNGGEPVLIPTLIVESGIDFLYQRNAGQNGVTNLLIDGALVSAIQKGDVVNVLGDKDDFTGNNTTNGERVKFSGATLSLDNEGVYTIVFSGVVKGNNGLSDIPISLTKTIVVTAQGCQIP